MTQTTNTDHRAEGWAIDDTVIRFRAKGSPEIYSFELATLELAAADAGHELRVGSGDQCAIRINDPTHRTSRYHARLFLKSNQWNIEDAGSKNGLSIDGIKQPGARLEPGMEVGIGGVTLVAESIRSIDLRSYLSRLFGWGWGDDKEEAVERALQAIRSSLRRRTPLVLLGHEDLVPVARDLYRCILGPLAPFIVCDHRRASGADSENVRSPLNIADPDEALTAAVGGTLCFRNERLPASFDRILERARFSDARAQIVVCGGPQDEPNVHTAEAVLTLPSMAARSTRAIEHIVLEYFLDAEQVLESPTRASAEEHKWVLDHSASSLSEISKATLRLTALRVSKSLAGAAERLGMKPVSLRRWIGRRGLPPRASIELGELSPSEE